MNILDIGAVVALVKQIPGTAAQRAEAAQAAAEAAAEQASQYNYGISVSGHTLMITKSEGNNA